MRLPILLPACALALSVHAQVDMGSLFQPPPGQPGVKVVDDNDPFAPNPFIGSFRMEMHRFVSGVEDAEGALDIHLFNSADKTLIQQRIAGQKQEMKTLKDLRKKEQYMLITDEDGGKMALKSHLKKVLVEEGAGRNAADIRVTEETKTIDGHPCVKMIATDAEGTWTGWLAKDFEAPFNQVMRSLGLDSDTAVEPIEGVHGFPMEYEWTSADGTEKLTCHMRDLVVGSVKDEVFSLEGYEVMELPVFGK